MLLLLCLALRMAYDSAGRKLSVEVGGAKRLQTVTTLGEAALLLPLALLSCFLQVSIWCVCSSDLGGTVQPLPRPVIAGRGRGWTSPLTSPFAALISSRDCSIQAQSYVKAAYQIPIPS